MRKIALGVTSSISIYKACEVVRGFQRQGFDIQVIMTPNATKLVSPRLFSALSGNKTLIDLFMDDGDRISHIALAGEISLLVIAPATANIIAVRSPVVIAPAMNEAMYLHPQTQANILRLRSAGVEFVLPGKGYLACKDEGWGRLVAPEKIVERGLELLQESESLKSRTVLVTAGPTREPIDPVRFISNRSSGKMGYALAGEARRRGARVILVSGPTALLPPFGVEFRSVETAADMSREVKSLFPQTDILIMAAAVADFRPAAPSAQKIKKKEAPPSLELTPTEDVLASLGRSVGRARKIILGFAAETADVAAGAARKLREKKLDLIVANDVSRPGIGFDSDFNQVLIIDRKGVVFESPTAGKHEISRLIMDRVEVLLGGKK
jgi:phosphopantothenoylcysteine decarboxylase/phosphopantothenate--cysteine ligase